MKNLLPKNQPIAIGQRVHTNLYGHGFGTVYAIHGEQTPQTVQTFGGGVICSGSTAHFDIVFDDGATSSQLPEAILLGVQWNVFDEVKDATFIQERLANAAAHRLSEQREAERRAAAREERRKAAIEAHPHLLRTSNAERSSKTAAKNIRAELKAAFPDTKFSVRSDYNSIDIHWDLGPTTAQVEAITGKYQEGHFNGMEDIYEHDHENVWPDLFGGARFVSEHRHIPKEVYDRVARDICALQRIEWRGENTRNLFGENDPDWTAVHVNRVLAITAFPAAEPIRGVRRATEEERAARNDVHFWAVVEFGAIEAQPVTVDEILPPETASTPPPQERAEDKIVEMPVPLRATPGERITRALAALEAMA